MLPGVWVAGNVTDVMAQVITSAAAGLAAAGAINADLINQDVHRAVAAARRSPPAAASPAAWESRYAAVERVWSGNPNAALVAETATLAPGRALDVGCGEGTDAVWLALRGWDVTALDVSQVALDRGSVTAEQAGARVRWLHAGLLDAALPAGGFELVSVQYPALLRTPNNRAEQALLDAVTPGGTLLVVHHADVDAEQAKARGFDPADYVGHDDVAAMLGHDWHIETAQRRPRNVHGGGGDHHTHDLVLKACDNQPRGSRNSRRSGAHAVDHLPWAWPEERLHRSVACRAFECERGIRPLPHPRPALRTSGRLTTHVGRSW